MNDSKNERAWRQLFELHHINDIINRDGQYIISSKAINKFREARLMTKFDHQFQLPKIFIDNHLSILPISRGDYVIAHIETFQKFNKNSSIETAELFVPSYIESLDFSTITSEAMAINCAYVSNIISDFVKDEHLVPTVSGRMSSQDFHFQIRQSISKHDYRSITVQNAQIEIDGGYEGDESLILIEAKNNLSSDFLIRQLYYPYRLWHNRVNKKVRPIFLTYTNGIFHLREYAFKAIEQYNSITLVNEKKYRLKDTSNYILNMETIENIISTVPIVDEPTIVPFPQADSFDRIINLCEVLYNNSDENYTKTALNCNYDFTGKESFDKRQVDYYTNAAIYLGFVRKIGDAFELTSEGLSLFETSSITERQLGFAKAILSHKVFNETLKLYLQNAEVPPKTAVVQIMKNSNIHNVHKNSTFERRAATVLAWIDWILNKIEE